eukprot:CAMPEP_0182436754 /NCGR_PEP_ID=MMETSP1167-20130531/83411_1 /TAXON_ID=2988 /ORGANISM="Mallomonas Sp, Strain CCMP3275" /LENGTH=52 /DNA_ID=CAMNT_0024629255 /DNA_START=19 /DNA_END=174 /DNA_ORIENTATION=+
MPSTPTDQHLRTKPTHLRIQVVDEGPIIPQEEYDKLFHSAFEFTPGVLKESQ